MTAYLFEAVLIAALVTSFIVFLFVVGRANAQVKRFRDAPVPKKLAELLREEIETLDERSLGHSRQIASLRQEIDDAQSRITSLQNKASAQVRRDKELDVTKLADYLQTVQDGDSQPSTDRSASRPTVAVDANGQEIDFR